MQLNVKILWLAAGLALSARCLALGWFGDDLNGHPCVGKEQGYGPFDYMTAVDTGANSPINLVERAHFSPEVENLVKGKSGTLGGDLDYTLRAFPNHHRALYSVIRYVTDYKHNNLPTPPECYLQRAIAFKPKDADVHMLYGIYLHRKHKYSMALKQYQLAEKLEPKSAEIHYNLGLLYFDMKKYKDALAQAKRAYSAGYPLPGLRNKLKSVGAWNQS